MYSIIWGCICTNYLDCIVRHPAIFFLPGPRPPCPSAQVPPPAGESRHRFTVLGIILILIVLILILLIIILLILILPIIIVIITLTSWFLTPHPAQIPTCWRERAWFQYRFQLPHLRNRKYNYGHHHHHDYCHITLITAIMHSHWYWFEHSKISS